MRLPGRPFERLDERAQGRSGLARDEELGALDAHERSRLRRGRRAEREVIPPTHRGQGACERDGGRGVGTRRTLGREGERLTLTLRAFEPVPEVGERRLADITEERETFEVDELPDDPLDVRTRRVEVGRVEHPHGVVKRNGVGPHPVRVVDHEEVRRARREPRPGRTRVEVGAALRVEPERVTEERHTVFAHAARLAEGARVGVAQARRAEVFGRHEEGARIGEPVWENVGHGERITHLHPMPPARGEFEVRR